MPEKIDPFAEAKKRIKDKKEVEEGVSSVGKIAGGLLGVGLVAGAAGGGGGGSSSSESPSLPPIKEAYVVDSPVQGLNYTTSSGLSGVTGANGSFQYRDGDTITFSIGGSNIASLPSNYVPADNKLTPQDMLGLNRDDVNNPTVVRIAKLLQSLDSDNNPDNGITLLTGSAPSIDIENATNEQLLAFVQSIKGPSATLVTSEQAISHLVDSLATIENKTLSIVDDYTLTQTQIEVLPYGSALASYRLTFAEPVPNLRADAINTSSGSVVNLVTNDGGLTYQFNVAVPASENADLIVSIPFGSALNNTTFAAETSHITNSEVLFDRALALSSFLDKTISQEELVSGVTITGTNAQGDTVTVSGNIAQQTSGSWTYDLSSEFLSGLSDGVHQVQISFTNTEGVTTVAKKTIVIDRTAPEVVDFSSTLPYGPSDYTGVTRNGDIKLLFTEPVFIDNPDTILNSFTVNSPYTISSVTSYGNYITVSLDQTNITRQSSPIEISYNGTGIVDKHGNHAPAFSGNIKNNTEKTSLLNVSVDDVSFAVSDSYYQQEGYSYYAISDYEGYAIITGSGFNKFVDFSNGASSSTNLLPEINNIVLTGLDVADYSRSSTPVIKDTPVSDLADSVYVLSDTQIRVNFSVRGFEIIYQNLPLDEVSSLSVVDGRLGYYPPSSEYSTWTAIENNAEIQVKTTMTPSTTSVTYSNLVEMSVGGTYNGDLIKGNDTLISVSGNNDLILTKLNNASTILINQETGSTVINAWRDDVILSPELLVANNGTGQVELHIDQDNLTPSLASIISVEGDVLIIADTGSPDLALDYGKQTIELSLIDGKAINIIGFDSGTDVIDVSSLLSSYSHQNFALNAARDADDRIIYEENTGNVYYDADGIGEGLSVFIANVVTDSGLALRSDSFVI